MKLLLTGATGLTGSLFLSHLAATNPGVSVTCLVRPTSDRRPLANFKLQLDDWVGDSTDPDTWTAILTAKRPDTILHIASIRHLPVILASLAQVQQLPRLIVIGTTSVYSRYHPEAATFQALEHQLATYPGSACLLRPTMIYGSPRDRNFSKLIRFCDRYRCFPVFGSGQQLIQPVHADDLAQALLSTLQHPTVQGAYDLSGATIVSLQDLLKLVGQTLGKTILPLPLPLQAGLGLATLLEAGLGGRSPLKRDQILRLQEDKTYPHTAAQQALAFHPRSLAAGLEQEVTLLRQQGLIQSRRSAD